MTFLVLYLFEVIFSANNYDPNNKRNILPTLPLSKLNVNPDTFSPLEYQKGHFTDHFKIEWNALVKSSVWNW